MSKIYIFQAVAILRASAREQQSDASSGILGVDQHARYTFEGYKLIHGRAYAEGSEEHNMRKKIFNKRLARIEVQNSRSNSWVADVNQFSDRTDAELQQIRGFRRKHLDRSPNSVLLEMSSLLKASSNASMSRMSSLGHVESSGDEHVGNDHGLSLAARRTCETEGASCVGLGNVACCNDLVCGRLGICTDALPHPTSLDYASKIHGGYSSLDQGACGSCWAVAAADLISLYAARSNRKFKKRLSPQGMLGCSSNPHHCGGAGGCDGSTPELAFKWAVHSGGLHTIDTEAYTATTSCPRSASDKFMKRAPAVTVAGFIRLPENRGGKVMDALVTSGPLSVAASAALWYDYSYGVFTECGELMDAHALTVDHAVLMMGYGEQNGSKYWKIRNSWGKSYGEDGFIRLARHAGTVADPEPCGWDHDPQKGVGCDGGPSKLKVCGECGILSDVSYPVGVEVSDAHLSS